MFAPWQADGNGVEWRVPLITPVSAFVTDRRPMSPLLLEPAAEQRSLEISPM